MMKQQPKKRPIMDERDMQIEVHSKAHSLEYVTTVAMILTVLCLLKDNPAWKGSLSLAFFAAAFELFYKYRQYEETPCRIAGVFFLIGGLVLLDWFAIAD